MLSYSYDASGRLTGAIDSAPGSFGTLGYSYDQNGNRQSETRNAGTMPYVYSPPNWLYQKGSDTRPRTASGNTASSTALGNFTYDGFNRLATSVTAAETTTYTYNALGQRIKKINQNGLSTVFHYGPNGELLYERDANGNTKVYVWLDGRPLARIDNDAQIYYYHVDHLGTPQAMTNSTGTVVWKADYEPFGKATVKVNTVENNLRFPGQYYDRETGLHYNYFRDYEPGTGRYIEADPIGLDGGMSLYGYVGGNPISRIDPLGLFFQFSNSQQSLTWVDPNTGGTSPSTTWPARSGPWGKGSLPEGWYELTPEEKPVKSEKRSMQDTCGNDYKFRLHPQFPTDRDGLLIHPDGGTPGTMGCIGAQGCTSSLRNFINSGIHGGGGLNVKVVP